MKRYRVLKCDFDTRARILNWGEKEKFRRLWDSNINQIKKGLQQEYGVVQFGKKCLDYQELGAKPFSIFTPHTGFIDMIRDAYTMGCYYPALTASCALGERILNRLILDLREYYPNPNKESFWDKLREIYLTTTGKKVPPDIYKNKSFSNWKLMIRTLRQWRVIDSEVENLSKQLGEKRHKSLHYNPRLREQLKKESLEAIKLIQKIIQKQFGAIGIPRYFFTAKGEVYIKKELEENPFIKVYYLPNCDYVSPYHDVVDVINSKIIDREDVKDKEITDEEFVKLREDYVADKFKKRKSESA